MGNLKLSVPFLKERGKPGSGKNRKGAPKEKGGGKVLYQSKRLGEI